MSVFHARLSPSGASRWMTCPGSVKLEAPFPDRSSTFANEGTAAHELAAACLLGDRAASTFIGETITVADDVFRVDHDMAAHVQSYVDLVRQEAEGGQLLVEQRLPIAQITNEEGAAGTADAVILDDDNGVLKVIDLKFGRGVRVEALDNPQLQMYALAALDRYSVLGDFTQITMIIHQPRLNHVAEFHLPIEGLEEFREKAKRAAAVVYEAIDADTASVGWAEKYLEPSPKGCKFCKAKATCPALRLAVTEVTSAASISDFADLIPKAITTEAEPDYLAVAMAKVSMVEDWCAGVRAEVQRRLLENVPVDGFKLVKGRPGNRAWSDEKEVAKLLKGFRFRNEEMYDHKLKSPAKIDALVRDNPRRKGKLEKLTYRPEGKPSVAPATDNRAEMTLAATATDFRGIVKTDN